MRRFLARGTIESTPWPHRCLGAHSGDPPSCAVSSAAALVPPCGNRYVLSAHPWNRIWDAPCLSLVAIALFRWSCDYQRSNYSISLPLTQMGGQPSQSGKRPRSRRSEASSILSRSSAEVNYQMSGGEGKQKEGQNKDHRLVQATASASPQPRSVAAESHLIRFGGSIGAPLPRAVPLTPFRGFLRLEPTAGARHPRRTANNGRQHV
jgi:hypothetical protein